MKIGVLALQGDFREHCRHLGRLGVDAVEVRLPAHLEGLQGLILPGGESTTMGKLMEAYDLVEPLRTFGREKPVWGTCAGAILMAQDVGRKQTLLQLMDTVIQRNAFGRQLESFEIEMDVPFLKPHQPDFHLTFIRGPVFERVYGRAEALLTLPDGRIIAARQGDLLATSFHPELTEDSRFHQYFLEMVKSASVN